MSRFRPLVGVLLLCLLLPACGRKAKLTPGNFAKIYDGMPIQEVESVLGRGRELSEESKAPPGGSIGGAVGGIAIPDDGPKRPKLLPRIHFAPGSRIVEWEEGDRLVQIVFVNDKMKVK